MVQVWGGQLATEWPNWRIHWHCFSVGAMSLHARQTSLMKISANQCDSAYLDRDCNLRSSMQLHIRFKESQY